MAKGDKYIGKILEGRWEVVRFETYANSREGRFYLKNIYNNEQFFIKSDSLRRIEKGETTLSRLITNRIRRGKGYKRR